MNPLPDAHPHQQQATLFDLPAPGSPASPTGWPPSWPPPSGDGPQRVLVTGSRWLTDTTLVGRVLGDLLCRYGALVVVHGWCAAGADWLADQWVTTRRAWLGADITADPFPADWDACGADCPNDAGAHRQQRRPGDIWHPGSLDTYCPGAGPRRNRLMVSRGAIVCVGFRQPRRLNSGTRGCMKLAAAAGIPTFGFDASAEEVAAW